MQTAQSAAADNNEFWSRLVADYRLATGNSYDEMLDGTGAVRPHWHPIISAMQALPQSEWVSRSDRIDRRVRDTGIAYDIFADPSKPVQRWQLDLFPIVISSAEWQWLSAAIEQRALLFNAVLGDIYGEQKLLRNGLIPPELVFSDGSYLLPCLSIQPKGGFLKFYAADLARGTDGRWRIIDNHTETLAGVGFALANRMVHTHVAGDIFKQANAVRLASHFQKVQASLVTHCGRSNARIALLTPGPQHEDYFSHTFIARYLGYLLVEGADLRTRGANVYLKTLEGLKEVDLIVRCADGRVMDPVELDPDGFDGPPGLLRVCRDSPSLVVNAVGSAVVQNRGLGSYLPRLCKHLLGEELLIEDAPRMWLGERAARERVLGNLDQYLIRSTQEGTGRPGSAAMGQTPGTLDARDRQLLRADIELHGARLVAEGSIGFSTAPTFRNGALAATPFAARFFVANTGTAFEAMPGGLAMTVAPTRAVALSAPDGHTRDVWVLSDSEQAPFVSLWRPQLETARVQRSQRVIQSRVADDLFWLGRYSERADWTMRVLRSALRRVEEDSGPVSGRRAALRCLNVLLHSEVSASAGPRVPPKDAELEAMSLRLISDPTGSRTLVRTFESLSRVAHVTRDRLSLEAWQTLSRFGRGNDWRAAFLSSQPVRVLDLLDEGLASVAAFNGLMHENMTRNYGWSFLDMGRRLERAYNLSEAILSLFVPTSDSEQEASSLLLLLELADSFITYRSRYRLDPMMALVLDLLLLDETNPRSLAYQLTALSRHMDDLPDARKGVSLTDDRRIILSLLTAVRLADVEVMASEAAYATLQTGLEELITGLPELSNAIGRHYFNLTDDAPHRVSAG